MNSNIDLEQDWATVLWLGTVGSKMLDDKLGVQFKRLYEIYEEDMTTIDGEPISKLHFRRMLSAFYQNGPRKITSFREYGVVKCKFGTVVQNIPSHILTFVPYKQPSFVKDVKAVTTLWFIKNFVSYAKLIGNPSAMFCYLYLITTSGLPHLINGKFSLKSEQENVFKKRFNPFIEQIESLSLMECDWSLTFSMVEGGHYL